MRKSAKRFLQMIMFVAIMTLIGCATQQEYQKAFDSQHSLSQNQCAFKQPSDTIFRIAKQVFVQHGFTIENADLRSGIIKAVRNMQDQKNKEYSYDIHVSADISEEVGPQTVVSLAASQQTVLHRSTYTWWHLFWMIPLFPTGIEYQTLVVKEGNITDPSFYADFFSALKVAVAKHDSAVKAAAKPFETGHESVAAEETTAVKPEQEGAEQPKTSSP